MSLTAFSADYIVDKSKKEDALAELKMGISSSAILRLSEYSGENSIRFVVRNYTMLRKKDCVINAILNNDKVNLSSLIGRKLTSIRIEELGEDFEFITVTAIMDSGLYEATKKCKLNRKAEKVTLNL